MHGAVMGTTERPIHKMRSQAVTRLTRIYNDMLMTVTYALLLVQVPMPRRFYTKYTAVHQLMINAMSHGKVPKRTRDPEMASQRELLGYVSKSDAG